MILSHIVIFFMAWSHLKKWHRLMTPHLPVCGAVVGTGRALVGPVTADIGHLLVTVVTPITGTLTVKHVTLIVNDSKSENDKVRHQYLTDLTGHLRRSSVSILWLIICLIYIHVCVQYFFTHFSEEKKSLLCVWGIVLSLHVTFSARGLRPWSGCGGVRVIVTDILP